MIVIFIHRFNDIDHLTPVIYKLAKDTDKEILLLAINPQTSTGIFTTITKQEA